MVRKASRAQGGPLDTRRDEVGHLIPRKATRCGRSRRRIHPEKEPREEELGRRGKEGKDEPKNGRTRDRRANRDEEGGVGGWVSNLQFQMFLQMCHIV